VRAHGARQERQEQEELARSAADAARTSQTRSRCCRAAHSGQRTTPPICLQWKQEHAPPSRGWTVTGLLCHGFQSSSTAGGVPGKGNAAGPVSSAVLCTGVAGYGLPLIVGMVCRAQWFVGGDPVLSDGWRHGLPTANLSRTTDLPAPGKWCLSIGPAGCRTRGVRPHRIRGQADEISRDDLCRAASG